MIDQTQDAGGYKIWAVDDLVYGPVEMPVLVAWVKDNRVVPETWIFEQSNNRWLKAGEMVELQPVFGRLDSPSADIQKLTAHLAGAGPGTLRRVKIFGSMTDDQIVRFARFMEVEEARQFHTIVRQGERGDAMLCILDGEVRVRQLIDNKETVLSTLRAGEFFGDISLFDHGPRSADVVANLNTTLLKISRRNLQSLAAEAPDLATAFLEAVSRTLVARIRADNKRLRDTLSFARAAR